MLNKIKTILDIQVNLEDRKLENGTVITAEAFSKGKEVFIKTDDEKVKMPIGSYELESGEVLVVKEEGLIDDLTQAKLEEEDDRKEEADVADWKGMEIRIKNLEDAIADLKADKVEASAETKEEEKTEMSVDVISELMTQVEELNSKIVELSKEPATDSISYNPEGDKNTTSTNLSKLSSNERVAYYINNLK